MTDLTDFGLTYKEPEDGAMSHKMIMALGYDLGDRPELHPKELEGTGLSPFDVETPREYQVKRSWVDEKHDREQFQEIMQEREENGELDELDKQTAVEPTENSGEAVADGGDIELPKNETVRLIRGITGGIFHRPKILEGETSSTGKTIEVEVRRDPNHTDTYRLDTEKILTGKIETRDATLFELYTPRRFRKTQRANRNPGPRAGVDEVADKEDLPPATHEPLEVV